MSVLQEQNAKKWIHAFLVIVAVLLAYIMHSFVQQTGDWFDLEAKIGNFHLYAQLVSIGVGLVALIMVAKSKEAMKYLDDVFVELQKVIWPTKDSTVKLTIGIVIAVIIAGIFFGVVDFGLGKLMNIFYN